jgi:hypothetical protein
MDPVYVWTLLACLMFTAAALVAYLSRLRQRRHRNQQDPTWQDDERDLW